MKTYLCVYLGSTFLALIITPAVIWLAKRIDAMDRPGVRTIHRRPIPRIGGITIFASAILMLSLVLLVDNAMGQAFRNIFLQVMTLLIMAASVFLVGLIDDLYGLPARFKFIMELLGAGALCLVGVRIETIGMTDTFILHLGGWGCLLTLLWIVGITNAVNLSDGLDGLATGISAIACATIALLSINGDNVIMAVMMLALLGSLSGFLVFNFHPARIFMGDCGSLFLGFTIAASSVMCMTKSSAIVGLTLPILALGIPIFDTLFSMLRRFLERRSIFAPDRSHFHHRLVSLGLKQRHAVIAIYLATLVFTGLGLFMMVSKDFNSLIIFCSVLLLILLLFRVVGVVQMRQTLSRLIDKYSTAKLKKHERQIFEELQLRFLYAEDRKQWWQTICEAAERMEFARVALKMTYTDGHVDEEIWRSPNSQPDHSQIVTMRIPVGNDQTGVSKEIEFAVWTNSSIEVISHRVTLFGQLLDEYETAVMG